MWTTGCASCTLASEGRPWESFRGPESEVWVPDPWGQRPPGGESVSTHGGGLVRYDGFSYRYFGVGSDGMSLKSNICHNVVEDRFHRLWISFEECTEVLDLKTMHSIVLKSKNDELKRIMSQMSVKVYCDSKGYIWIVERNDICRVEFDESGDVKDIIKFGYTNNTPDIAITDINNDGSVWAAIDGGLYRLVVSNHEIVRMDISPTFKDLSGNICYVYFELSR